MANSDLPVLIIGAGFAGLCLAQGLRRLNIPFLVFEQEPLSNCPCGHRFRLDVAGIDSLLEILPPDLSELFERTCPKVISRAPTVRDPETLERLPVPPRPQTDERASVPIDRTWILQLLRLGIEEKIHNGKSFTCYTLNSSDSTVTAKFSDSKSITGRLLIGADGIRSQVRHQLQPHRKLLDTERQIIWCRTWITPSFTKSYNPEAMTWFVGLDQTHSENNLVLEPIRWRASLAAASDGRIPDAEDYIYWAFATEVPDRAPSGPDEMKAYVQEHTKHWSPGLAVVFDHADWDLAVGTRIYSSKPDIGNFSNGQGLVMLLGDSAHPMTPQGGLGGSTAVQAVADFCRVLEKEGWSRGSMEAFEERMRALAKKSIEASFGVNKMMTRGKDWQEFGEVDR